MTASVQKPSLSYAETLFPRYETGGFLTSFAAAAALVA